MRCFSFVHDSLAEPVSIALYLISVVLLGVLFYWLVIIPIKTPGKTTQEKLIKSAIFLIIFLLILLGLPQLREFWLYWVEWCMEVYAPVEQGVVMNVTP